MSQQAQAGSWKERLRDRGPLTWERWLEWGASIVMALGLATASAGGSALLDIWINGAPPGGFCKGCCVTVLGTTFLVLGYVGREYALCRIKGRGTLYYVRLLHHWMLDERMGEIEGIRKNYADVRAVTRWASASDDGGGVDLSADVVDLWRGLEQAMNEDSNDTTFTIAPNLLWPAAMSLGYSSYFFERTSLGEITPSVSSSGSRAPTLPTFQVQFTQPPRGPRTGPDDVGSTRCSGRRPAAVVALEVSGLLTLPEGWPEPDSGVTEQPGWRLTAENDKARKKGGHGQDPNEIAARCAKEILRSLRADRGAYVVLVARLPKSLALLIGWRLGQKLDCEDPLKVWERLVTVQLVERPDENGRKAWEPVATRVHPAQPDLAEMVRVVAGLSAGGPATSTGPAVVGPPSGGPSAVPVTIREEDGDVDPE